MVIGCFLAGCGKTELYSNLKEAEANQMMAILLTRGIVCEKGPGPDNTFILTVDSESFAESVQVLKEYGYPQMTYQGVGQVFQKSGLVSSPTEERIRFMHALSQDIAATIALIDGVLSAQVHIVLPNNNPFVHDVYPSSAAIFVSYRPDSNVDAYISQIKSLVMNSVEGLSYDKISIAFFPSILNQTTPAKSATVTSQKPIMLWAFFGLIGLLIISVGGYFAWKHWGQFKGDSAA
jgi:type III secretion protein J